MEWWTLFRRIRVVSFAFISIASLAFAVILSFYLSKEWVHSSTLQRAIILAMIGVNALTSLLLYLMAVVVFRMWKELLRMLFLLAIHTGVAVPYTLYGFSLSCAIFDSASMCKIVDLAFLSTAWSITGLLLGYTVYLCIMSRVPRPFPLVTPIDLLASPTTTRATSMASVHSATHLLAQSPYSPPSVRPASPASVYSQHSAERPRTVPKRLFVANSTSPTKTLADIPRVAELQRATSYGATTSETREIAPSSRFSTSTMESVHSIAPSPPRRLFSLRASRAEHLFRRPTAPAVLAAPRRPTQDAIPRVPPRPLLLNPNPFADPLSRHGTPETALSTRSFPSAPMNANANQNMGRYGPSLSPHEAYYLSPYTAVSAPQLYANPAQGPQMYAGTSAPAPPPQMLPGYAYLAPYAVHYAGPPSRAHTATPSVSSIHSMSPSIHFHADSLSAPASAVPTSGHPASLTPAHPANVHLRSPSDPVPYRSYSADPRLRAELGEGGYEGVALPNPYTAGAEIRRYGSVPHMRAGGYAHGYGAPPAEDPRWREAVMKAAAGRA